MDKWRLAGMQGGQAEEGEGSTTRYRRVGVIALLIAALAVIALLPAASAHGAACDGEGDGEAHYHCEEQEAVEWIDIDGTDATPGEDGAVEADIGFEFSWFGRTVDAVFLSEDGLACFSHKDVCDGDLTPKEAPEPAFFPHDFVACFSEDLNLQRQSLEMGTRLHHETVTVDDSQVFVASYENVTHDDPLLQFLPMGIGNLVPATDVSTFQLQLWENGEVRCYIKEAVSDDDGIETLIGIEGPDGEQGWTAKYEEVSESDLTARFIPVRAITPPQNVAATASDLEVTLTWEMPRQGMPVEFWVFRNETGDSAAFPALEQENALEILSGSASEFHDLDVSDETEYCYRVSAVTDDGEQATSDSVCATVPDHLTPPENLTASFETPWASGGFNVSWDPPSEGTPSDYWVFRNETVSAGTFPTAESQNADHTTTPPTTWAIDIPSERGFDYCYKATAVTSELNNTTASNACAFFPQRPEGAVSIPDDDPTTFNVSWTAPGNSTPSEYRIFRNTTAGSHVFDGLTAENATYTASSGTRSVEDPGRQKDTLYCYTIVAVYPDVKARNSTDICGSSTISSPADVEVHNHHNVTRSLEVHWKSPSNAVEVWVFRNTTEGPEQFPPNERAEATAVLEAGNESWTDSGLANGTTYAYRLAAANSAFASDRTTAASASTDARPAPPENVTAIGFPENGTIMVQWQGPPTNGSEDVTAYDVYRDGDLVDRVNATVTSTSEETEVQRFWDESEELETLETYTYRLHSVNLVGPSETGTESNDAATVTDIPAPACSTLTADVTGACGHTARADTLGGQYVYVDAPAPTEGQLCFGSADGEGNESDWTLHLPDGSRVGLGDGTVLQEDCRISIPGAEDG